MKRYGAIILCVAMACMLAWSADIIPAPAVRLHYPPGYRELNLSYENSAHALNVLTRDLRVLSAAGEVPGVEMTAFCSPDADNVIALNIARSRAWELQKLLGERSIIGDSAVELIYKGVGWDELVRMVAVSDILHRQEVMDILSASDLEIVRGMSGEYSNFLIERLKQIEHGRAYRYIQSHIYPILRNMLQISTSQGDSAGVYYRIGYQEADFAYAHNGDRLNPLIDSIAANPNTTVRISCFLFPSGDNKINYYIGRTRYEKLRNVIAERSGIDPENISFSTNGDGWNEVRHCVEESHESWRSEVLRVLSGYDINTPSLAEKATEGRIKMLKAIDHGKTYHLLATRYFPTLRNTVILRPVALDGLRRENLAVASTDSIATNEAPLSRWSVKTNLIYDALLSPSVEAELRFSDRWSVAMEYNMAWWKNSHDGRTYRIAVISPEFRYHFSSSLEKGHYVGAFSGFTWYDLSSSTTGHRGEGYFAGVSYGYLMRLSRTLGLEAGIGVGYLSTRYKDYTPFEGHHVYRRTKTAGYFGPLKVKLALVWRFNSNERKSVR